ncbi:MAG: ECF transporter S component [Oscillospiraceae bacterium]
MSMSKTAVKKMVLTAVLSAIIIVMSITPLGYLKIAALSISFLTVPVTIGAVLMGPVSGAVLGLVFGITSFVQCFGMDAFGTALLGINPFYTGIVCIVPRVLMGLLTGLIFMAMKKFSKNNTLPYAISSVSGALLNTLMFMSALILFFYNTDFIMGFVNTLGAANAFVFAAMFVGLNGVVEIIVAFVLCFPITKALSKYLKI